MQTSKCQPSKEVPAAFFKIWYESLFDGTLGDWKTKPVSFQLKEENTTPWLSFPSAKNIQDTVINEVERVY